MNHTSTCPDCGWTSKPTRTEGYAAYALRKHSCEKHREALAALARRAEREANIDRNRKPCRHKRAGHIHGTHACYVLDRCRCHPCAEANAAYERARRRRNAYGRADLVDAEPVRAHIRALVAAGMSHQRIKELSGSSSGAWTKIMYGVKGRPPARRVRRATAERYLTIPMPTRLDEIAARHDVAAGPTRDRIRALARIGWSAPAVARAARVEQQSIYRARDARDDAWVSARTARRVAAAYDELWDRHPIPQTRFQAAAISRVKAHAERRGWPPPMGLDDEELDRWKARVA